MQLNFIMHSCASMNDFQLCGSSSQWSALTAQWQIIARSQISSTACSSSPGHSEMQGPLVTSGRCCLWASRSKCMQPLSSWQGRVLSEPAGADTGPGMLASTTALRIRLAPVEPVTTSTTAPGLRAWMVARSKESTLCGRRSDAGARSNRGPSACVEH